MWVKVKANRLCKITFRIPRVHLGNTTKKLSVLWGGGGGREREWGERERRERIQIKVAYTFFSNLMVEHNLLLVLQTTLHTKRLPMLCNGISSKCRYAHLITWTISYWWYNWLLIFTPEIKIYYLIFYMHMYMGNKRSKNDVACYDPNSEHVYVWSRPNISFLRIDRYS